MSKFNWGESAGKGGAGTINASITDGKFNQEVARNVDSEAASKILAQMVMNGSFNEAGTSIPNPTGRSDNKSRSV